MKIGKKELKGLIKECLIEILAEGLGEPLTEAVQRAPRQQSPVVQPAPRRAPTQSLREAVRAEANGNPVMESILADTAATTLQAQLGAGDQDPMGNSRVSSPGDAVSMAIANVEPSDLFGSETASKWAELAFAPPAHKPSPA